MIVGQREGAFAVTMETCAFPNLDFKTDRFLGPGEIVLVTPDGFEVKAPPGDSMRICSFLWVYYGYPCSEYERINVEAVRNRCGRALAARTAIQEIEGNGSADLEEYADSSSEKHAAMIERICKRLKLTTLRYQRLDDLVGAIGLPAEKLCTYCWNGVG